MKTMRCRNFFRFMTIFNLCQVAKNVYEVWLGHFGDTMYQIQIQLQCTGNSKVQYNKTKKQQKLTDQSYLIFSTAYSLLMCTEFLSYWHITTEYKLLPYTLSVK